MRRAHRDQNRVLEWREIAAVTEFEFLLEIAGEIVMPRKLNRRAEWCVRLHKNFAGRLASPGASSYLREKLKGSFARAEIGQMQRQIGVDDSDERHIREMQAFASNLYSNRDGEITRLEVAWISRIGFFTRYDSRLHRLT